MTDEQVIRLSVDQVTETIRLDRWLVQRLPEAPTRSQLKAWFQQKRILVNDQPAKPHHLVRSGEIITVHRPSIEPPQGLVPSRRPIHILHHDAHIIVVNKPAGVLTHPTHTRRTDTVVNILMGLGFDLAPDHGEGLRPGVVHRLDEDTSGVVIFARHDAARAFLSAQFQQRRVLKIYKAVVEGHVGLSEGRLTWPIGRHPKRFDMRAVSFDMDAKEAQTDYRLLETWSQPRRSYVALFPKTGRTHQLRVHCRMWGHPIVGDRKYGHPSGEGRLMLHAQVLGFHHPGGGWMEFSAALPDDFLSRMPSRPASDT